MPFKVFLTLFFTFSLCSFHTVAIAKEYEDIILSLYKDFIAPTLLEDPVDDEIEKQSLAFQNKTLEDYAFLEKKWQRELENGVYTLLPDLLTRRAALTASRIKEKGAGVISTVTFVDKYGLNVAQSDITKNYWNKDAFFLQQPVPERNEEKNIYVSDVSYDPLSTRFIVTAAFPVHNKQGKQVGYTVVNFDALELECITEGIHAYKVKDE